MKTLEQEARELLERVGVEDAAHFSSGDLIPLTHVLHELSRPTGAAMTRKVIQLATMAQTEYELSALYALCDDGTMWAFRNDCGWVSVLSVPQDDATSRSLPDNSAVGETMPPRHAAAHVTHGEQP